MFIPPELIQFTIEYIGRDAGSNISDTSWRRGRPEAALDWHLLQSIVDSAIDEWRQRLHAFVDKK